MKFISLLFCLLSTLLIAETTIPGGAVSGIWDLESSPYHIEADIIVELNSQLIIEPGVSVIFSNQVQMEVFGSLQAEGTAVDSIYFQPENIEVVWTGIRVYGTEGSPQDSTLFRYCSFKYAKSLDGYLTSRGGALLIYEVDNAIVDYCGFTHNTAKYGGGLHVRNCSPTIQNSSFRYNEGTHDAGGILLTVNAAPLIKNCLLEYNRCCHDGGGLFMVDNCSPTIENLTIRNNIGRGITVWSSSPVIRDCEISFNGGGIALNNEAEILLEDCLIEENIGPNGAGILSYGCSINLAGCTIKKNSTTSSNRHGGGIYASNTEFYFSETNLNSIYLNNASGWDNTGNDIYLSDDWNVNLVLDSFTVLNPDEYFIFPIQNFDVNIIQGVVHQTTEDIFVAPYGANSNSGLDVDNPIKSIYHASIMALPSEGNPITIHLADGVYSPNATEELFPLRMKSFIKLLGSEETVLDAEQMESVFKVYGLSGLELNNLSITGATSGGVNIRESNISIVNSNIHNNSSDSYATGGAVSAENSNLNVIDSKIHNNTSGYESGGGIYLNNTDLYISGSSLTENESGCDGGGIYFTTNSMIDFDQDNLNSIYNNSCNPYYDGRDFSSNNDLADPIFVVLDTFTVMNPQNIHASPIENFTFEISHSYFPQIDADLYVSPEGDNENSGTSESEPLQSLSYALDIIFSNPESPNTIYLADGVYSNSTSAESFPCTVRDYTKIQGASVEGTILDGEIEHLLAYLIGDNIILNNLTIINGFSDNGGAFNIHDAEVVITNVTIKDCCTTSNGGGFNANGSNLNLNNVEIKRCSAENNGGGIYLKDSQIQLADVSLNSNTSTKDGGGIYLQNSTAAFDEENLCSIYLNNCISSIAWGRDIYICQSNTDFSATLDTLTVLYPTSHFTYPVGLYNCTINNYIMEQYDCDLYVSPNGSDENTGISEENPLKTISKASLSIVSTEENPRTIILEAGTYSSTNSGEVFPIKLTGFVNITGEDRTNTIIDGENENGLLMLHRSSTSIESIALINAFGLSAIDSYGSDLKVNNVLFKDNYGDQAGAIYFMWLDDLTISNSIFDNDNSYYTNSSFSGNALQVCSEKTLIYNCTFINSSVSDRAVVFLEGEDTKVINCLFWNNEGKDIKFNAWSGGLVVDYTLLAEGIDGIESFFESNLIYGENNLEIDPLLSTDPGSYMLQQNSPCIDTGVADYYWDDEQIFFIPDSMYIGSAPDMGACEYGMVSVIEETLPEDLVPAVSKIWSNYPNPFNPSTTISFSLKEEDLDKADILIYNIKGQLVKKLNIEDAKVGMNSVVWDGKSDFHNSSASGVYLYTLKIGNEVKSRKKMLLLK